MDRDQFYHMWFQVINRFVVRYVFSLLMLHRYTMHSYIPVSFSCVLNLVIVMKALKMVRLELLNIDVPTCSQ